MKEQEAYFDLIAARQSCRRFDPLRPVEREKLDRCLEAARLAPSACNSQPWRFHVATGEALCTKLRPCVQRLGMNRFVDDCPAFIVVTEARSALKPLIAAHLSEREFSSVDIGIATAHLCLAATAQGLSTCIIGWLDGKKICAALDLPETTRVRLVIAVGYAQADDPLRKKQRKPLEEIVTFHE